MATLVPEAAQAELIVPAEKSQHANHFGLISPWEHYYHPTDTAPQGRFECELDEMVVFGDIPTEISGTWYRMLIDPHFCPQVGTPFVDGDGHVCAFRIQDSKISMKIKYIHTERWLLERKAGRRLLAVTEILTTFTRACRLQMIALEIPTSSTGVEISSRWLKEDCRGRWIRIPLKPEAPIRTVAKSLR